MSLAKSREGGKGEEKGRRKERGVVFDSSLRGGERKDGAAPLFDTGKKREKERGGTGRSLA